MEELLRNELEEKARTEMRAQILAEARLAARPELEDRPREERAPLAHPDKEARPKQATGGRPRGEQGGKLAAQVHAHAAP